MSESALSLASSPDVDSAPADVSLDERMAEIAQRLAALLDGATATGSVPLADAARFLVAFANEVTSREGGEAGPLSRLAAVLRLSPAEIDLTVLAGLAEEEEGISHAFRLVHPRGEPRPTVSLASKLLCRDRAERRLLRSTLLDGPAVARGLLRCEDGPPFPERNLVLADSIWDVMGGIDAWPASIVRECGPTAAFGLEEWLASEDVCRARRALSRREVVTLLLSADHEDVALHRAAVLAEASGAGATRLRLPVGVTAESARLASLHAAARGHAILLAIPPADGPHAAPPPTFDAHPGPVVLCARHGALRFPGSRPLLPLEISKLRPTELRRMWSDALPELGAEAPVLAGRYSIEPELAARVSADVRVRGAIERRSPEIDDVADGIRARSAVAASSSFALVRPRATWDRLVLRAPRRAQLTEAVDRLLGQARVLDEWRFLEGRPGARGVRMLFSGPSGTGKSLSAEVIAHALGLDLFVVDVSRVVSKWIGETEKNLAKVFDAAESATAVLLFDEADALFGRRTDVSDAHDKYANLETAFLLSRLERFEGMTILSTNLKQNVDPAFLRRLEFIVEFEEPGPAEREALWKCHVPRSAPLSADVEFDVLSALYPVVGGLIRNAAVAAAFLAATEDAPIAMRHLVHALRREYDKAGRAFPGAPPGVASIRGQSGP